MEILPKVGIDIIRFGMSMDEVRSLWGQPESIDYFIPIKESPEDRNVEWKYSNGIVLSFGSDDDFLLSCISSTARVAKIKGFSAIGQSIQELKLRYPNLTLDDDFEENGQDYVIPELDISVWAFDDIVDSLTIFPEYDTSGNYVIWPLQNS